MKTLMLKAAAVSAAILLTAAAPAQADPVPDGAVRLFLKDHPKLPMAVVDGTPRLTDQGDFWELSGEAAPLKDLGEIQIVHQASGQCLTADTSGGGATVPVVLADCANAIAWTIAYDKAPGHRDFRFVAAGDYLLGLRERADAVDGAEILAVRSDPGDSMHFHEWLTESQSEATPPADPDPGDPDPGDPASDGAASEEVAPATSPEVVPAAALPTTGAAVGAAIGSGATALAVGAALVLWWQRRRALRSDW
ncbi:hypothetical protein AB0K52_02880 [Glycomyces sp. NPDC049804]|uniref:hypothetical protein n=1 Tax=Glycomyces sp. NPDC049804 TaxID=3154363 RepID=UPI00344A4F5F